MAATSLSICPRCRSSKTAIRSNSAVAGVWTVFGCDTCFYAWRSTEPVENTDPAKYPEIFRLDPKSFATLPPVPTIPPLRKS